MKTLQKTLLILAIVAGLCALLMATASAEPAAPTALTITKVVSPTVIDPEYTGLLTYTITLLNDTGAVPSFMTDTLPTYLSFNAWVQQPAVGTTDVTGNVVTWSGSLAAGTPVTLTFTAKLPDPETMSLLIAEGRIVNTAYLAPMDGTVILPPEDSDTAITRIRRRIFLPLVMRNFTL